MNFISLQNVNKYQHEYSAWMHPAAEARLSYTISCKRKQKKNIYTPFSRVLYKALAKQNEKI